MAVTQADWVATGVAYTRFYINRVDHAPWLTVPPRCSIRRWFNFVSPKRHVWSFDKLLRTLSTTFSLVSSSAAQVCSRYAQAQLPVIVKFKVRPSHTLTLFGKVHKWLTDFCILFPRYYTKVTEVYKKSTNNTFIFKNEWVCKYYHCCVYRCTLKSIVDRPRIGQFPSN